MLATKYLRFALLLVFLGTTAPAAEPEKPGDKLLAEYFKAETALLQHSALEGDWKADQAKLRRQLEEMLGLSPMPERTPLNPVVTKTTEQGDIIVENLHFQSRPGLYVTANFYRPKTQDGPLPAILYVCGHALVKKDGVSYGNKAGYHHHGAWFARNGYVCLTIDTLQLGEIEGIHHGTHRLNRWWWNSRGYTPAGVEAWNGIRAIDYLQSRPEVDGEKIGITGRSGGGAYSWYTAALDERIKVAVPVAGITDLQNHIVDDCVEGHCDCMFMVNTYRWDYPRLISLIAPRPLLISNTDKDSIFPLDGVVRTHTIARELYKAYDAEKNLGLQITEGPHKDTQELRIHSFVWFDRYLKGENRVIDDPAEKFLEPEELKVFTSLPTDELNTKIDETFVDKADEPKVPTATGDWQSLRADLLTLLMEKTFAGWRDESDSVHTHATQNVESNGLRITRLAYSVTRQRIRPDVAQGRSLPGGFDFVEQYDPFGGSIYLVRNADLEKPKSLRLSILDDQGWEILQSSLQIGADGSSEGYSAAPESDQSQVAELLRSAASSDVAVAFFAPRGVGPTAWTDDAKERTHIRRRFMLLGQTLDGMRVLDIRRAIAALRMAKPYDETPIELSASGDSAVLALYASLFTNDLAKLDLTDLPTSHREGPDFLNIMKYLDLPQTVALAADQVPVVLHTSEPDAWSYPRNVADRLGWETDQLLIEEEPGSSR